MNDRCATVVLSYVFSRIFATDVYPAGIKLRLEIFRGNLLVENVKTVFAVDLLEFKVVVVVEQCNAVLLCGFAESC